MRVTTFKNVPFKRKNGNGRWGINKGYKKLMKQIGECQKASGHVSFEHRIVGQVDFVDAKLFWADSQTTEAAKALN